MLEKVKKYYQLKKYNKAEIIARRELKKSPGILEYYYLLGLIYYSLNKLNNSLKYLDMFLEHNPNQIDALIAKTHCLRAMNKNDEAIHILNKLLNFDFKKSDIFLFLGECHLKISQVEKANSFFQKSLELNSSKINLLNVYKIYNECNFPEKASKLLKESSFFKNDDEITLKYCNDQVTHNLLNYEETYTILSKFVQDKVVSSQIYNLLGMCSLFLGKIEEAKKNFLASVDFDYTNANLSSSSTYISSSYYQLAQMNYKFDENSLEKIKNLLGKNININNKSLLGYALSKIYYNNENFSESAKFLKISNKNIYKNIILPRGWTFEDELKLFQNLKKIYHSIKKSKIISNFEITPIFILGMPRSGTTLVENILSQSDCVQPTGENGFILNQISEEIPNIKKSSIEDSTLISKINSDLIFKYFDFLSPKKKYFTDKTPLNFLAIGIIKILIPNSKIIYCKRNMNDNLLSMFQQFFHSYSFDFSYDFKSLKKYYDLHTEIIKFWDSENISFFKLKYEDLITNKQRHINDLCSFIGINYSDEMLEPHLNKRYVNTASSFQVRQPINSNSVNKWDKFKEFF